MALGSTKPAARAPCVSPPGSGVGSVCENGSVVGVCERRGDRGDMGGHGGTRGIMAGKPAAGHLIQSLATAIHTGGTPRLQGRRDDGTGRDGTGEGILLL